MTTAVMVSGGLDSYIAWRLTPNPKVAVWVDLEQPYAWKEQAALDASGITYKTVTIRGFYPKAATVDNWIIPARNLLLALAGAQHGEMVLLSALEGEMHSFARERDKTPEFFHMATAMFTYTMNIVRPETVVTTPFKTHTKTDIVAVALGCGVTPEELMATSSCYHETLRNCGICGTCFKRWIAMKNNGINEEYANPPWEAPYAVASREGMRKALADKDFSHYSYKRIDETRGALARVGLNL